MENELSIPVSILREKRDQMRAKGEYTKAAGLNEVIEEAERHQGLTPEEIKYLEERRRQQALELENYVPYYSGLE